MKVKLSSTAESKGCLAAITFRSPSFCCLFFAVPSSSTPKNCNFLMAFVVDFLYFVFIFCSYSVAFIVLLSLTLATFGASLDIRKTLSKFFLKLFEWVTVSIERYRREHELNSEDSEDDENDNDDIGVQKNVIEREASNSIFRKMSDAPTRSKIYTVLDDSLEFIKAGIESIIQDDVTCRFEGKQLPIWNLLTRSSNGYQYVGFRYLVLWCLGFLVRYFIFLPCRIIIFFVGLIFLMLSTATIGYLPHGKVKRFLNWHVSLMSFRVISRALSIVVTYHNRENMAKPGGICVANHTSPLDVQILSMDNCYAFVGQKQGGFLGMMQRAVSRASAHVWFERAEAADRLAVRRRLQEHVEDIHKRPILIFPEGTCINNTSVMMFKKGSFEVGGIIYPAAIKYDSRFGEAFWNSSKQSYLEYIFMMMTSWAIVVDVLYLPPMKMEPGEDGFAFAARVKHAIASAGGWVELDWDGQLKRYPVKQEMLEKQRLRWSRRVQRAPSYAADPNETPPITNDDS